MQAITFQAIPILIDGHDTQGQLVAVLARLDGDAHDRAMQNWWNLEAGFGTCEAVGDNFSRPWVRPKLGSGSGSLIEPLPRRLSGSRS